MTIIEVRLSVSDESSVPFGCTVIRFSSPASQLMMLMPRSMLPTRPTYWLARKWPEPITTTRCGRSFSVRSSAMPTVTGPGTSLPLSKVTDEVPSAIGLISSQPRGATSISGVSRQSRLPSTPIERANGRIVLSVKFFAIGCWP